ncbi:undecaprenyl-diphosphate phosphatase [Candidatus Omnitrophota bacterium]
MLKSAVLGIVQGLTEFLPVSSSGHLVILQRIFGMNGQEVETVVILHLGTVLALVIFFFKDILLAMRSLKLLKFIFIVSLITGAIAIAGKDFFESLFSSPILVSAALVFTGAILLLSRRFMDQRKDSPRSGDSFILGIAQGVAIIPGISRSGITICALLFRKLNRDAAFRLSFLASIPAVLGAVLLETRKISLIWNIDLSVGLVFSFLTGLIALRMLKTVIKNGKLYLFGYYCFFIAIITLLFIR